MTLRTRSSKENTRYVVNARLGRGARLLLCVMLAAFLAGCKDYTYEARSQVVDAMGGAYELRLMVTEIYMSDGRYPTASVLADWGKSVGGGGRYHRTIEPESGVVNVTFTEVAVKPLRGKSLRLEPHADADFDIQWRCVSDNIDSNYLPANCR